MHAPAARGGGGARGVLLLTISIYTHAATEYRRRMRCALA
jgi:hypothetical protein